MARRDQIHDSVRHAIENDGWTVTHDPFPVAFGLTVAEIDLGAERLIAAERGTEKIAVEAKSFASPSVLSEFHTALGQYLNYRHHSRTGQPMEKLAHYRDAIWKVIQSHSGYQPAIEGLETYTVHDADGDHYQIVRTGWANEHWYYGVILHFDIKNGKIWIQHNGTEHDVAAELVELGVPPEDIVLGFQSPVMREYGDYAVA